jgi:hypothetical protein
VATIDVSELLKKYMLGPAELEHDEIEILLFALYLESVRSGGIAKRVGDSLKGGRVDGLSS